MEFQYRDGEPRTSFSFMSSSNPQPRLSLQDWQRKLEEERIKEEIIASRIAQLRMIEEERLRHEMRMQHHPALCMPPYILELQPQPQPLIVLPPDYDLHRDRFDAYPGPIQADCGKISFLNEVDNSVPSGAVRDEGGSRRRSQYGFEKRVKKKRALSGGKKSKEFWCRICKVSCSGKVAMDSHLFGKKHSLACQKKSRMQMK